MNARSILRLSELTDDAPSSSSFEGKILVLIGSYAPVHQGHVELLNNAANWYIEQGITVKAAVLAPNSESYVTRKLSNSGYHLELGSITNRIQTISEFVPDTLPDSDVITVVDDLSCIEVDGHGFINTITVKNIAKRFGCKRSDVVMIVGADQLGSMKGYLKHNDCLVVSRPGQNDQMFELIRVPWVQRALRMFKLTIIDRPESCVSMSSTEIRKQWSAKYRSTHLDIPTVRISIVRPDQIIRRDEEQVPVM